MGLAVGHALPASRMHRANRLFVPLQLYTILFRNSIS
jgi:hypothetical protein